MKVLLLAPTPPPFGGIAGWTERMINAQLKNDWKIDVVDEKVINGRETFGEKSQRNVKNEIKRCFKIWFELNLKLKNNEVKIVHSCIPSLTTSMLREYVCAVITKLRHRKFIIHFRCTVPNTTKGILGHFMLKRICAISDLVLVLNEYSEKYLKAIINSKIRIIPNFVLKNEIENEVFINEEIKTALYVGGIIEEKGAYILLNVAKQTPQITFRLVGKTDKEVIEYAEKNQIKNVIFVGTKNRDEMRDELKNADVFIFPTFYRGEGFSNALAEAMAAGLPCIATDWAANKDMLEEQGGCIVPIKNDEAIIAALKKISSKEMREKQSQFNIKKVKNTYQDNIVLTQYVDAYETIIEGMK